MFFTIGLNPVSTQTNGGMALAHYKMRGYLRTTVSLPYRLFQSKSFQISISPDSSSMTGNSFKCYDCDKVIPGTNCAYQLAYEEVHKNFTNDLCHVRYPSIV